MSHLGEDVEAFFRKGEEGTYDGGPASLMPFATSDEPEHEPLVAPTEQQLARRRRFARLVTTIVGSFGAVLLLALLLEVHARGDERGVPVAHVEAPHRTKTAALAPTENTHVESAPAIAPHEPPAAPVTTESPAKQTVTVVPAKYTATARPTHAAGRAHATRALTPSIKPAFHSPPTANFPD